jgi:hypothetical protein
MSICLGCGGHGPLHRHHVTGRGCDGDYLDPELLVGLCWTCHHDVHDILRTIGCDTPGSAAPGTAGRMRARLVRLAVLLGVMATAESVVDLRAFLDELSRAIDTWSQEVDQLVTPVGTAS